MMMTNRYEKYRKALCSDGKVNETFKRMVSDSSAFCAAKMGMVELMSVHHYLNQKKKKERRLYRGIGQMMYFNAGIFPASIKSFDRFNEVYLSYFSDLDFFGMWVWGEEPHSISEKVVYDTYTTHPTIVNTGWMPFYHENSWGSSLKDKRVLVVSPFADTIHKQYKKRDKIWNNEEIFPQLDELRTIKCPLSAGLEESPFESWEQGLNSMEEQMSKIDFDVCFVGAGAWGLPLAVHAKRLGKIGIHTGGDTQLLFGIKGKRWDDNPDMRKKLYNEHWVRPSQEETPKDRAFIEGGCYW